MQYASDHVKSCMSDSCVGFGQTAEQPAAEQHLLQPASGTCMPTELRNHEIWYTVTCFNYCSAQDQLILGCGRVHSQIPCLQSNSRQQVIVCGSSQALRASMQ